MNVRSWKSDFRSDVGFFKEQKFPLWVETEKKKKETMKKDQNRKKEKSTLWRSFYEPIKRTEMVVPSIFEVRFMTQLEKIEHEPRNL